MNTVPISEVIPLMQWIQIYHAFRVRLDLHLYQSGLTLQGLHTAQFGPETSPGVWETGTYRVLIGDRTLTFEVLDTLTTEETLSEFKKYQTQLFRLH